MPPAFVVDVVQRDRPHPLPRQRLHRGRLRRHKAVAAVKLGLPMAGAALPAISCSSRWRHRQAVSAPRDAMISLATPKEDLGAAFGALRGLDIVRALLGPLLAFAIVAAQPRARVEVRAEARVPEEAVQAKASLHPGASR